MPPFQVCPQGHRWDPLADDRTSAKERWNVCPICGTVVAVTVTAPAEELAAIETSRPAVAVVRDSQRPQWETELQALLRKRLLIVSAICACAMPLATIVFYLMTGKI